MLHAPDCRAWPQKYGVIGEVRGRGAMIGGGDSSATPTAKFAHDPNPELADKIVGGLPPRRASSPWSPRAPIGNVLRFLPPLVIGDDLLNEGLDILADVFATV